MIFLKLLQTFALFLFVLFFLYFNLNAQNEEKAITQLRFTFFEAHQDTAKKWFPAFQQFLEKSFQPFSGKKSVYRILNEIIPTILDQSQDTFFTVEREVIYPEELEELRTVLIESGKYSSIILSYSDLSDFEQEAHIQITDRLTMNPTASFSNGGGITTSVIGYEDPNFFNGLQLLSLFRYRTENEIGSELFLDVAQQRLFTLPVNISAVIKANKVKQNATYSLYKPLFHRYERWSFGVMYQNESGSDFVFQENTPILNSVSLQRGTVWGTWNYPESDQFLVTLLYSNENIQRGSPQFQQAFDNTARFLVGVSSLKKNLVSASIIHPSLHSFVTEGGWGTAVLGRVFAPNDRSMNYIGGQAERTVVKKGLYLHGRVSAGSGFDSRATALNTYQDFYGLLYGAISDNFMVVSRLHQQKVWNWNSQFRQLILDNESGLRGYQANQLVGENRAIFNLELRYIPQFSLGFLTANPTFFYDGGTVFNAVVADAKFYHSVGAGLRFHSTTESAERPLFRIDGVYNFYTKSLGVQFSVDDIFSFPTAKVHLPTVYGLQNDLE